MSRADTERLAAEIQRNPSLLEELRDQSADPVRWAHELGYEVTADELKELLESDRELSDDELEEAAGGDWTTGTGTTTGGGG
jgi:predicted ribosomally synthesized peptide with nif11-like leader